MKKILLFVGVLYLSTFSFAITHDIVVRNFEFSPSDLSVEVGDTIRWIHESGSHTTTSVSVPENASSWDDPMTADDDVFLYHVEEEGTYDYQCTPHAATMTGSFTASTVTGISKHQNMRLDYFPNPVKDLCTVEGINIDHHTVLTPDGQEIKSGKGNSINLSGLRKGVYLLQLVKDDKIIQVLRVLKE